MQDDEMPGMAVSPEEDSALMTKDGRLLIQENVPLAPFTTLGVGGPARYLAEATTGSHILEALEYTQKARLPLFVLGGGSNLLVSDRGFEGFVLRIALRGIHPAETASGLVTAAAGEDWDGFVAACIAQQWGGIECLSGIPGSVGGTPVQNVGAYGQEVSEVIESVRVIDRHTGSTRQMTRTDCEFRYRTSIFNSTQRDRHIILEVTYQLHRGSAAEPRYPDLQRIFSGRRGRPSLDEIRNAVLKIRAEKSMLRNPADPDGQSAGSFFKNPVIDEETWSRVQQAAHTIRTGQPPPHYRISDNSIKVPAAWLIEQAGFCRGFIHGNAGISSKHALALINRGGARAQEILDLMKLIQEGVEKVFGIQLSPEPVFLGF